MFNIAEVLQNVPKSGTEEMRVQMIPLEQIADDPRNSFYSMDGIEDLAGSIQTVGLVHPVSVRPDPENEGKYILVSGHRRRAAYALLAKDDPAFAEIPAIVSQSDGNAALEELRLIFANSQNRVRSPYELSQEAKRVQELLYQLKENGMEFPGRMRDHVAQAVQTSKTKLSQLKVVEDCLIHDYRALYEADEIPLSVAYSIARLPGGWQRILAQNAIRGDKFVATGDLIESRATEMRRAELMCNTLNCPVHAGKCSHLSDRLVIAGALDRCAGLSCRGCCLQCGMLATCGHHCFHAAVKRKELRQKARDEKDADEIQKAQKDAPRIALIVESCKRVLRQMEVHNIDISAFTSDIMAPCTSALLNLQEYSSGAKEPIATDYMPIGKYLQASDAEILVRQADVLGCSIDYLLGRTETVEMAETAKPGPAALRWQTGTPPKDGLYIVQVKDNPGDMAYTDDRRFKNGAWQRVFGGLEPIVLGWLPMPEDPEEESNE